MNDKLSPLCAALAAAFAGILSAWASNAAIPAQHAETVALGACEVDVRPVKTPVVVVGTDAPLYTESGGGGGGPQVVWSFDNTVWPDGSAGVAVKIGDWDGVEGIRLDPLGHTEVTITIDPDTMTGTLHIDNGLEPPHNVLDVAAHIEGSFDPLAIDPLVVEEEIEGATEETGRTRIKAMAYGLETGFTLTEI